ncbi:DUF4275 family protein [Lachnotalea glycerini]|uniref:DUF4275 family protein n=1 Tax=Lachnotalea glycerini TaxID=1763509 RepID=A0A371JBY8_9FIRM|nr:DUF4275 family protein [Lachnotalea glycerini]RDY30274.1 DUF4275 family protein [Lachnotalea glycerini]
MIDINVEFERISLIKNKKEKEEQQKLLDEIISKNNELCDRAYNYEQKQFINDMKIRDLEFLQSDITKQQLLEKWISIFADDIDDDVKERIYIDDNLWHIFSYKRKNSFEGNKAVLEFDNKYKEKIYIFYQNNENIYMINNASNLKFTDLAGQEDIYIVDESFLWTFIITHETINGPYYYTI